MSTAHVFRSTDGLVLSSLRGAVSLNPSLRLHAPSKTVFNAQPSIDSRVILIAGGGSGHEPAHAGYTGRGMLAASIAGDVFASPSPSQICTGIRLAISRVKIRADSHPQVLLIINNYTGDRLNFGLAAEKARASIPNLSIDSVVVADDVSLLSRPDPSLVGPRGLAGNILVCKLLGAAADTAASLPEIKSLGDAIVAELATIGVGLEHCHIPGRHPVDVNLPKGQCEIGLGLHNEPGARTTTLADPSTLISEMLSLILACGKARGSGQLIKPNDSVILFVNNLGGISTLEMGAIVDETISQLLKSNIHPVRVLSSSFMTSLNAPGFSLSLLNLSAVERNLHQASPFRSVSILLGLLDAPTDAVSWPGGRLSGSAADGRIDPENETNSTVGYVVQTPTSNVDNNNSADLQEEDLDHDEWERLTGYTSAQIENGIRQSCKTVSYAEPSLTQFDTEFGDGDCGETFKSGAKAVLSALDSGMLRISSTSPSRVVERLADILEDSMGGTSGALFGIYLTALTNSLRQHTEDPLSSALKSLSTYTPARTGDRTLVDALSPFCHAISKGQSLDSAVKEARKGAESTREMKPRLGRAVYVRGNDSEEEVQSRPPDPGAWGVMVLLEGFLDGVQNA